MGNNFISFKERIFIRGTITAITGLHIGGSSTEMSIGGADSIVVRDPITNYPYIPGSSLRGKMRSLLEKTTGEMTIKLENDEKEYTHLNKVLDQIKEGKRLKSAGPSSDPSHRSARLFGISVDKQKENSFVPQRLVVRDAKLTDESVKELENAKNTDMPLTEVKTEVTIDRITSKATPRQIERVPAGAEFEFEFVLNLYEGDERYEYLNLLWRCMELLQDDYLGGNGSRGYGKVKFKVTSLTVRTREDYINGKPEGELKEVSVPETLL